MKKELQEKEPDFQKVAQQLKEIEKNKEEEKVR